MRDYFKMERNRNNLLECYKLPHTYKLITTPIHFYIVLYINGLNSACLVFNYVLLRHEL